MLFVQPGQQRRQGLVCVVWQQRGEARLRAALAFDHHGTGNLLRQPFAGMPGDQVQAQIEAGLGATGSGCHSSAGGTRPGAIPRFTLRQMKERSGRLVSLSLQ
jgi:hypothetical protein